MKLPKIQKCPGCGDDPQLREDTNESVGVWCDCGFNASIWDVTQAAYLANFYPLPDVRITAWRIANRMPLLSSLERIA